MFKQALLLSVLLLGLATPSFGDPAGENKPEGAASSPAGGQAPAPDANPKPEGKPDPKADGKPAPQSECVSDEVVLIAPEKPLDNPKQFRDTLGLRLSKGCADAFKAAAAKSGNAKAATVVLDGVEMKGLTATPVKGTSGAVELLFSLNRNSEDDDSRKTWDTLLSKQRLGYPMQLPVALAIGGGSAVAAAGDTRLVFTTVQGGQLAVAGIVIGGIAMLLGALAMLLKGNALRDGWGGAYSLGKSQLAFWGLIVFLSFAGVWIITGNMERVPPQTLILIGISGVTGLAAVMIGTTKDSPQDALAKLNAELAALGPGPLAPAQAQRAAQINRDVLAITAYMGRTHVTLRDFFRDICDDGSGASFHRIQVLIWTLMLGAVFVWSVTKTISMPEFPQTLLLLMGISNGTYLGFKFPEKV